MTTTISTLAELKGWLFPAGVSDSIDDGDLQRALDAAGQWIENYTGRLFALDAADVTRYYYADEQGQVDVLDLTTVTSIKLDTNGDRTYATTLASTDYELLPVNGPRYDRIRIWPTSSKSFGADRRVQIIGKAGYVEGSPAAAPPAVKQAHLILSSRFWKRSEAPFGVLGATDIGTFQRISKEDPDVVSLLTPYRSASAAGAAVGGTSWVMI